MTAEYISYHPEISEKLKFFLSMEKIPNIIFHGPCGSGKRTLVHKFVNDIYHNEKDLMKAYVMNINCAHGKGIRFVREDLKFFAKTHINIKGSGHFKTVILANADNLTVDAQSALRRCIELFSHTTRFFIIVEDKYKILKPILSRLCEIFVAEPLINGVRCNIYKHNITKSSLQTALPLEAAELREILDRYITQATISHVELINTTSLLYEKCYSGRDIMKYIEEAPHLLPMRKYQLLLTFQKVKKDFKNEKLFIFFILSCLFVRSEIALENISFM
jgi:DNA polymerase III delta prime subunit